MDIKKRALAKQNMAVWQLPFKEEIILKIKRSNDKINNKSMLNYVYSSNVNNYLMINSNLTFYYYF